MKIKRFEDIFVPLVLGLAILVLFVGIGLSYWLNNSDYVHKFGIAQFLFGPVACGLIVYFGLVILRRGIFGLLNPYCAILLGFELFLLIGPLLLPEWAYGFYNDPDRVLAVWLAVIIGLLSFLIGYRIYLPKPADTKQPGRARLLSRVADSSRLFWFGVLFVMVRTLFFEYWAAQSSTSVASSLLAGTFANTLSTDTPFLWGWWFARLFNFVGTLFLGLVLMKPGNLRMPYRILAGFFLFLAFYGAIVEGNRGAFLDLTLGVVVVALTVRDSLGGISETDKVKTVPWLLIILIMSLTLLGVVWQTLFRTLSVDEGLQSLGSGDFNLSGSVLAERGGDMLIYLDQTLTDFGTVTPHTWGSSYVAPFVLLIPRNIWPDKPVGTAVYLNNAGPTIVGEFYANFSWPGIVIGMALLGILMRVWYEFYLRYRKSELVQVLFAMSIPVIIYEVRGDFNSATNKFIYPCLFVIAIWYLCSKPAQSA